MNQGWTYYNYVDQAGAELTILEFYTHRYPHSSGEEWQARIETGQVRLEGKQASPDTVLKQGQRLAYHRPPWQEPTVPLAFDVLYEDADLLVIHKPSGLPVLPGGGFLEHTLLHQVQQQFPQEQPFPIHRLGRGTSGAVLMARSQSTRAALSQQMRDRQIQKVYRALIGPEQATCPLTEQFEITQAIGKIPYPGLGYIYAATPKGRPAHSACKVLQRHSESTLLEVAITTGRPHQIRIHLAAIGYPLLGDPLYVAGGQPQSTRSEDPSRPVPGDCGYWLHAFSLQFIHPRTQKRINIVSEPPQSLKS